MTPNMKLTIKICFYTCVSILTILILILIFYKPSRIFFPMLTGVSCPLSNICIDDLARIEEADQLSQTSILFVQKKLGAFSYTPKFIYCASEACFNSFGFSQSKAETFGTIISIIGPKGWKGHIVRHELIHQWQADQFGNYGFTKIPRWLLEGMAYDLSDDPRPVLKEPWQQYRQEFRDWHKVHQDKNLIEAISEELK